MGSAQPPLWDNPLGTDGFEFIEYAAPDPAALGALFEQLGFTAIARHRSKNVLLYRQGEINFVVNAEPHSFAQAFARVHGPSICAIAFRVRDAALAYKSATEQGAWAVEAHPGPMELNIPAIKGIGDSLIYLVDRYPGNGTGVSIYDIDFVPLPGVAQQPKGAGLTYIDHLTHNVHRGRRVAFQDTPDTYYDLLATRLPNHQEDTARLRKNRVLLDGAPAKNEMLLQIFTTTVIGPIFFEIIQRKGNEGFGEGNFRALFESIELDQIRRGVLDPKTASKA